MKTASPDRRKHRSNDPQDAIAYRLAASVDRANFSAMVLSDANGFVVAKVGDNDICEQMAALSPGLATDNRAWYGPMDLESRTISMTVAPICINDMPFYLAASGGDHGHLITREMIWSGMGVARILA
jgi:hypothetical protein